MGRSGFRKQDIFFWPYYLKTLPIKHVNMSVGYRILSVVYISSFNVATKPSQRMKPGRHKTFSIVGTRPIEMP